MRRPVKRRITVITVSLACLAMLISGVSLVIRASHAQTPTASGTPPAAIYTLITGERVVVNRLPDGGQTVSPWAGGTGGSGGGGGCATPNSASSAGSIEVMASGPHLYVLPIYADGYIGQPLSIDLFDVNAMTPDTASSSATASSPIPLKVDYTAGSAQQLPPGLSTSSSGGVVVTDRAKFGQALAQASRAEKSGEASSLFAGIAHIAPEGATAASASATPPDGKLYTVTVRAFDRRGLPTEDSLGILSNIDGGSAEYSSAQVFYRGTMAFSVPAGYYDFSSNIHTFYADNGYDDTLTVSPQIHVTRDMTIVLEARKGQPVSVKTPLAATSTFKAMTYQRDPQNGVGTALAVIQFCDNVAFYATPTAPVSIGKLSFYSSHHLVNAQGDPGGYTYDLDFPYANAIPSNLAETVTADELATIDSRYHSSIPGRAEAETRTAWTPGQEWVVGGLNLTNILAAPLERTEYVNVRSDVFWQQQIVLNFGSMLSEAQILGRYEAYTPGQQVRADWMGQPLVSGIEQETSIGQLCPICRSDDTLTTRLSPFTDNQGDYLFYSFDSALSENLTLYQNGTQIGQSPFGVADFALSPDPATYKLVYDVSEDTADWPTSTHIHTAWTFASQERAPGPLPPGWECDFFDTTHNCSVEPLLFTQYHTSAGLNDVVPAGAPATVEVTVSHQRGAAATPISHVSAQVSFDDGKTWQTVPATAATEQGPGVYRLQYSQPELAKTSGFASLRIQAADSAGNTVDQTITRAYPLAVTAPAQLPTQPNQGVQPACATASIAPYARCLALVNTAAGISLSAPHGLGPSDIQAAYQLAPSAGQGRTVAIVDAFDDPQAEADLAVYRAHYGLPACSSANGCFTKVNQRGAATDLPMPDPGWSLEISLDLDAVSATCPQCKILLVEADSAAITDLVAAVQTADRLGANVISNSYGSAGEFSGEQYVERSYRNLSVPFVVASGDYGYGNTIPFGGVSFPSASQYAIAVGGTTLTRADTPRGWSETAWGEVFGDLHYGATSGCSAYIHKPGWQKDTLCDMRTVADVAAVADPETGLAIYDTFIFNGWLQVGGTSLSAPIIASVYAMAGDGSTVRYASGLYEHPGDFFDVVSGQNGGNCSGTYLCTAVPGYDGPTGLGTPKGTNAFH